MNLLILDLICRWNHTIFALCVFVISFNVLSGFIHTVAYIKLHSCLWLHSIPLYVNIHMLFIHQLMDTGVISVFFFLTVLINAAMNIDIQIFESLLSVLLGTYPGVELLDQMALFTCFRNQKAFSFPALELRCCRQAFSSCRERGCSLVAGHELLTAMVSLVAEYGSVVVALELGCPMACGIFLDQGSNLCPFHWRADS